MMQIAPTEIPDVVVFDPKILDDSRGFFFESYNAGTFAQLIGRDVSFVQDNHSRSVKNVLRGLHYQIQQPQGKLIRVILGEIMDVAVDLRRYSPTFGRWTSTKLSAENRRTLWIPPGFAHGFLTLSDIADTLYKATDFYAPVHERTLLWSDPDLGIPWPLNGAPILSVKDQTGVPLRDAEYYSEM